LFYTKKTKTVIQQIFLLIICCLITLSPVFAEEAKPEKANPPVRLTVGSWNEDNVGVNRAGDFTFQYYIASYDKFSLRYDNFTGGSITRRYWANYGSIPLVSNPNIKIGAAPGVMLLTSARPSQLFVGTNVKFDFPTINLDVEQRSYFTSGRSLHYTFTNYNPFRNVSASHVYWTYSDGMPRSYLGPKVNFKLGQDASVFGMYGFGLTSRAPDARFLHIGGSVKF
jgi:hypothetical protein